MVSGARFVRVVPTEMMTHTASVVQVGKRPRSRRMLSKGPVDIVSIARVCHRISKGCRS